MGRPIAPFGGTQKSFTIATPSPSAARCIIEAQPFDSVTTLSEQSAFENSRSRFSRWGKGRGTKTSGSPSRLPKGEATFLLQRIAFRHDGLKAHECKAC